MAESDAINRVDEIFEDLQAQILRGDLVPGARLPSERALAQMYSTHRQTLREATIRLEQQGLVSVHHGRGATVRDFRKSAQISILVPFLEHSGDDEERLRVFADLLPSRVEVMAVAARMASRRSTESDLARLKELSQEAIAAFHNRDRGAVALAYHQWLEALVDAAHSLPVRWMANALLDVNARITVQFPELWIFEPSFPSHMVEVVDAVQRGEGEEAVTSMRSYFLRVDKTLAEQLAQVLGMDPGWYAAEEAS